MSNKLFGIIPRKTLDLPDTATDRIVNDPFLNELFTDEVKLIQKYANQPLSGLVIEIGAAGGNTKIVWPEVITTDVRASIGIDRIMNAEKIDAKDNCVSLIFGMDALHHVRNPEAHFRELQRVLRDHSCAIYIEPNWNFFSQFCFKILLKYLHPEPYNTKEKNWILTDPDPMMGNQSQAYNIFVRDIEIFQNKFPNMQVEILEPLKGISFLLSGGVHTRLPIPSGILLWMYRKENKSMSWINLFGLGRVIKLTKVPHKND
jgi:SAM-dependent methyltransferase